MSDPGSGNGWRESPAIEIALLLGLVIAALGVLTSRVDVVLLALPLLLSAALAIDARPLDDAVGAVRIDVTRAIGENDQSEFAYNVHVAAPRGTDLVHLRLILGGHALHEVVVAPDHVVAVTGRVPVAHSGRQRVVEVGHRLMGLDGGWISPLGRRETVERDVDASIVALASLPLPHRLIGMTGAHVSARPGDGGEFRDLHLYAAGDRLRRIDWKATARRSQGLGDLYVRRTDATADATIMLVIDGREDVSERVAEWSARYGGSIALSSMDIAREAAASIAATAINLGDRVGLIDLAAYDRVVSAGGGKRHLDRLLRRIASSAPSGTRVSRKRAPVVPVGAMIYLLSTFFDDETASIATLWRAAGHRVIAVDVLPALIMDRAKAYTRIAHQLLMIERGRRITALRANGIELMRWQDNEGSSTRAVALRMLARTVRRRA